MSIYAWHFTDGNKLRDGTPLPAVGEWLEYEGEVRICRFWLSPILCCQVMPCFMLRGYAAFG